MKRYQTTHYAQALCTCGAAGADVAVYRKLPGLVNLDGTPRGTTRVEVCSVCASGMLAEHRHPVTQWHLSAQDAEAAAASHRLSKGGTQ